MFVISLFYTHDMAPNKHLQTKSNVELLSICINIDSDEATFGLICRIFFINLVK